MVCAPRGPPGFTLRAHPIRALDATTPFANVRLTHRYIAMPSSVKHPQGKWRAEQYWLRPLFLSTTQAASL